MFLVNNFIKKELFEVFKNFNNIFISRNLSWVKLSTFVKFKSLSGIKNLSDI